VTGVWGNIKQLLFQERMRDSASELKVVQGRQKGYLYTEKGVLLLGNVQETYRKQFLKNG
jgi:hypothetical protein